MMLGTTGGITEPSRSRRSGITRNQAGCGLPGGGSPGKGVLPSAIMPPVTVTLPTPGALCTAPQGELAPLTMTALIATSTGVAGGEPPAGGTEPTGPPTTPPGPPATPPL